MDGGDGDVLAVGVAMVVIWCCVGARRWIRLEVMGFEWVLMVVFDGSNREKEKGVFVVQRAARAARE